MQSFTDFLPWVWLSWVSPPSDDLGACLCGSSPAPGQIHPGSTAWSSCACWTCPACCLPGWGRWWSPAAGWSNTLSHSQNAPFVSSGASLALRLSQLRREKREPWHVNSFSSRHVGCKLFWQVFSPLWKELSQEHVIHIIYAFFHVGVQLFHSHVKPVKISDVFMAKCGTR